MCTYGLATWERGCAKPSTISYLILASNLITEPLISNHCSRSQVLTDNAFMMSPADTIQSVLGSWNICVVSALAARIYLSHATTTTAPVASESKICSQIGIDLMKAVVNAVDAVGSFAVVNWFCQLTACRLSESPFLQLLAPQPNRFGKGPRQFL